MTTIHRLDDLPADRSPCVVTIGVFDGVHCGHAQLISRTVDTARRLGLPADLVTFDSHPALVVGPPRDVAALTSIPHRADLATDLGIDTICVLPFTREFARLTPSEFVDAVLADALRAAAVVVGENFTFGHRGSGTAETLTHLCKARGISTDVVRLLHHLDATCSSTSIRAALRRGDIRRATSALGRPHRIDTTITRVNGAHEIQTADAAAVPGVGRYFVLIDGSVSGVVYIDSHGDIELCHPKTTTGPASIEFIDRLDHPQGQSTPTGTTSATA